MANMQVPPSTHHIACDCPEIIDFQSLTLYVKKAPASIGLCFIALALLNFIFPKWYIILNGNTYKFIKTRKGFANMNKILVLAEKPSVARDIARVLKCNKKENGFMEGAKYR